MTTDYASLDDAIVKAIREGCGTRLKIEIFLLERGHGLFGMGNREISPHLQSLRRRGIIEYKNCRWSAVESVK